MNKILANMNYEAEERKIGLEVEFYGVPLNEIAKIIKDLFGGEIEEISNAVFKVNNTEFGNFTAEVDARAFKKLAKNTNTNQKQASDNLVNRILYRIGILAGNVGEKVLPFEIISPPIKISQLPKMELLREALLKVGVKDTRESFYTAFGLHINPEVKSLDADYTLRHIQSFLLLAPWLKQLHMVDVSRRVTGFIDLFPKSYLNLVLDSEYLPDSRKLIIDYHKHNPSRNRALDMLPLFAYINEPLVRSLYGDEEKINKRPTFHYRLPNCEISNEDWSFNLELKRWLMVEKLANNKDSLHNLIAIWKGYSTKWFSRESAWIEEVKHHMEISN